MSVRSLLLACAFLAAGLTGCTRAGNSPASPTGGLAGPLQQPSQASLPQPSNKEPPPRTYTSACGPCHSNGGFAVRVLSDRLGRERSLIDAHLELPPEAIPAIVRKGRGAMPAMSRIEVSDAELADIVAYLGRARTAGARP